MLLVNTIFSRCVTPDDTAGHLLDDEWVCDQRVSDKSYIKHSDITCLKKMIYCLRNTIFNKCIILLDFDWTTSKLTLKLFRVKTTYIHHLDNTLLRKMVYCWWNTISRKCVTPDDTAKHWFDYEQAFFEPVSSKSYIHHLDSTCLRKMMYCSRNTIFIEFVSLDITAGL